MLEQILKRFSSLFSTKDIDRRAFLASGLTSFITTVTGCGTYLQRKEDKNNHLRQYTLTSTSATELSAILNDLTVEQEVYLGVFNIWPGDKMIWPFLASKEARIRFTKTVIARDLMDNEKYYYDKPDDLNYQPCDVFNFKGLDDPDFQTCQKKREKSIDPEHPMLCRHFARKFMWVYGQEGKTPPFKPVHVRYNIPYVEKKFSLPLREVEIVKPEQVTIDILGKESFESPQRHMVIGVWLDDQPLSKADRSALKSHENWYLFDPQHDTQLLVPSLNYQLIPGAVFLIYPEHNLPLDTKTKRPLNVGENKEYSSVLAFAINKDKKVIPAQFLGTRQMTQLVYEQAAHQKNFSRIMDKFSEGLDSITEGLSQVIINAMKDSGNFTDLEIKSIRDWKYVLIHPETLQLPERVYLQIKDFLSYRENYFNRKEIFTKNNQKGFIIAFEYLNRLAILSPSETAAYKKLVF